MGTGTTLLAAARCDRNAIGVELEQNYIKIAQRRLDKQVSNLFRHEAPVEITDKSDPHISQPAA